MRRSRDASFCDWVRALCGAAGVPVPQELEEPEGGLRLPLPRPRPVFRDLVRAYEQVLHEAGRRKGLGMYYTPPELMDCLLETALEPCIARCLRARQPVQALLQLRILDPSCGAGDFLLAGAVRVARAIARARGETGPHALQEALRAYVQVGIYGVDVDPVAVGLSRVNVYLQAGVWLGAHVACGHALLGVMSEQELQIPEAAYAALPGDDAVIARQWSCRHRACPREAPSRVRTGGKPVPMSRWREAADMAVAPFLLSKQAGAVLPLVSDVQRCLAGELQPDEPARLAATEVCRRERVWHWLGAFGAERAGAPCVPQFDCVLGNPPWEKLVINGREWFAARRGHRAPGGGNPPEFGSEKRRMSALAHYLHACPSRLPRDCSGIINLYAPFLWLAVQLCAPGGRVGMVVPTGLMSDRSTLPLFHALHGEGHLRHFYDFENRRLLFPGVDRRQRFACVTLSREPSAAPGRFAFFLHGADEVRQPGRVSELDASVFRRINPLTHSGVSFRCEADARLALEVHARLALLGEAWSVQLRQGLFNMTADRRIFLPAGQAEEGQQTLPLYEGRMFHLFEPRFGGYRQDGTFFESGTGQLAQPGWTPAARYDVPRDLVLRRLPPEAAARGWLPVFRMVSSPTNERSFICSIVPLAGIGNSAGLLIPRTDDPRLLLCLVANLSALVFDYQVRLKLSGNNLNFHIVTQLPVLAPEAYSEADRDFVAGRMLRLLYTWHGLDTLAQACRGPSRPYARQSGSSRARLRAELDAWYARRYGLNRAEFSYILDPHLAPDLPGNAPNASTFAILRARELSHFGEYRTARLCLAAYEALAASEN